MKKQHNKNPQTGDVFELKLKLNLYCYGRVLKSPLAAFYSVFSVAGMSPESVIKSDILFKVWIMKSMFTSGRWKVIANFQLTPDLEVPVRFFKRDLITKRLSTYCEGIEKTATLKECQGLECAAVWSAEHIESRLEDYFSGKPNAYVNDLSI